MNLIYSKKVSIQHLHSVFLGLIIIVIACYGQNNETCFGTSIIAMNCDITNNGKQDSVFLKLNSTKVDRAVLWNLLIKSNDKIILNYVSDDSWLDSNFYNTGFVMNCISYATCKKRYYETLLIGNLVKKLSQVVKLPVTISRKNMAPIYAAAEKYYIDSLHFKKVKIM